MEGEQQRGCLIAQLPTHTCPGTRAHTCTCMHTQTVPMPSDCQERGVDHAGDAVGGGALLAALLTTTAPALDSAYSPPLGQ